jgi:hypothetical protein
MGNHGNSSKGAFQGCYPNLVVRVQRDTAIHEILLVGHKNRVVGKIKRLLGLLHNIPV